MSKDREGLFIWEKWDRGLNFSAEDFRGIFDPKLSADCRSNGYQGILRENVALASLESWGDGIIEPSGLVEGDCPHCNRSYVSIEDVPAINGESPWPF